MQGTRPEFKAQDKAHFLTKNIDIVYFSSKNMLWVLMRSASLRRGASHEYPLHIFSWRIRKIFRLPNIALIWSYVAPLGKFEGIALFSATLVSRPHLFVPDFVRMLCGKRTKHLCRLLIPGPHVNTLPRGR